MAAPTKISGRLTSGNTNRSFQGMRVVALFQERVILSDTASADDVATRPFVPSRRVGAAAPNGTFALQLPEKDNWREPLSLFAESAGGIRLGELNVPAETTEGIEFPVRNETPPVVIPPNEDPTLGRTIKFTGRALDPEGKGLRAGPLVVFWGIAPNAQAEDRFPIAIAAISAGGYFSAIWPPDILGRAFAQIAGGDPIDVPLENQRFPLRVILISPQVSESNGNGIKPPRAPDEIDLASNLEAFAVDPKPCTDFTIPNRTVEEVSYHALVRTTQPEIHTVKPPRPLPVPPRLLDHLVNLANRYMEFETPTAPPPSGPMGGTAVRVEDRLTVGTTAVAAANVSDVLAAVSSLSLDLVTTASPSNADEVAQRILARRDLKKTPLRFESSVLAEIAQEPGAITPRRLLEAEQASTVRLVRTAISNLGIRVADRFHPGADRQINWESMPAFSQATTIAHGHLLTINQVWKSDGYSLGDLLYSLPLAPGQQKLISILDWERREIAMRAETRRVSEDLNATLLHDRDISEIVSSSLEERMTGRSRANVASVGGAIGGFVGALVFGAAGGVSSAGSTASQASARDIAGSVLNVARDRTMQAASSVRSQRATVVQTARQGETVRAQTEVIANYNHCHALTIEYFEVLRHLQVGQEIAHVQECLFIPLKITPFTRDKALAWRTPLQQALRNRKYLPYFEALERVATDWQKADFPLGRYADEFLTHVDGEFRVRLSLPRPADKDNGDYDETAWEPYRPLLADSPLDAAQTRDVWDRYMGVALPAQRPQIWNTRLAPGIAQRLFNFLRVELRQGPNSSPIALDVTLVTTFRQNSELLVTFRPSGTVPSVTRAQIDRVKLSFAGIVLPAGVEAIIERGTMYYRTAHFNHFLFRDHRVLNDLSDSAEILTPLDKEEKRNPREVDRRQADSLLDHLNYHVDYYSRATMRNMHPNRRYMLLDGVIAPNAGGRSVASVVENRIIAIVGNSIVMPVAPGVKLDNTYVFGESTPQELIQLYATDPAPPMRVSLPTRGVFAEAVLGKCNSCEVIDDTVFWRWEEAPIPDRPTSIQPISTAPRDTPPVNLQPTVFPDGVVRMQQVPTAPAPTAMEAALQSIGLNNIFRDLTGLKDNQIASASALDSAMSAAKGFSSHGLQLAQQKFMNSQMDRALSFVKQAKEKKLLSDEAAKEVTADLFRKALNLKKPEEDKSPTKSEGVASFIDRITKGVSSAALRIANPLGLLELLVGPNAKTSPVDFSVQPAVTAIQQDSPLTCWAAAGAMMASWKQQVSMSIETALGNLGGQWLGAYKSNQALTIPELRAFAAVLQLKEEADPVVTVDGMLQMLQKNGPLWVIADDSVADNKLVHARIVTAIKGDGTPENTEVTFIDTATGEAPPESFHRFIQKQITSDTAGIGIAAFHY
jgi:hypothetical protein